MTCPALRSITKLTQIEAYQGIVCILDSYDVRNSSGLELRKYNGAYAQTIVVSLAGKPVFTSVIYDGMQLGEDLIEEFCSMFGDELSDLKPVSRNPRSRMARDNRDNKREYLTDSLEIEYTESSRYDNHIVSELLPNYSISLEEVLDF